jgi:hypothetical protein
MICSGGGNRTHVKAVMNPPVTGKPCGLSGRRATLPTIGKTYPGNLPSS